MSDAKVTPNPELGPTGEPSADRGRRWLAVAATTLAVLLAGWLLRPGGQPDAASPEVLAPPAVASTDGSPSTGGSGIVSLGAGVTDARLGELAPGFVDTLTMLAWDHQGVEILRWRPAQPAPERLVSFGHHEGWSRGVDASGRWFAEIRAGSGLTVGGITRRGEWPARSSRPEATEAGRWWSAVWHDTRPGQLAWLACEDGTSASSATLTTTDVADPFAEPTTLALPDHGCDRPGVWLARWGDWGLLLHRSGRSGTSQVLLGGDGREMARGRLHPEDVWFVGVGPEGTTAWTGGLRRDDPSSFLRSPDGPVRRPVPGLAAGERLEAAEVSPDGSFLALLLDLTANYGSEVRIVDTATGSVVAEIRQPTLWMNRMVWSSDSRFLVYQRWPDVSSNRAGVPQGVELVLYDTRADAGVALPFPHYAPVLRSSRR